MPPKCFRQCYAWNLHPLYPLSWPATDESLRQLDDSARRVKPLTSSMGINEQLPISIHQIIDIYKYLLISEIVYRLFAPDTSTYILISINGLMILVIHLSISINELHKAIILNININSLITNIYKNLIKYLYGLPYTTLQSNSSSKTWCSTMARLKAAMQ